MSVYSNVLRFCLQTGRSLFFAHSQLGCLSTTTPQPITRAIPAHDPSLGHVRQHISSARGASGRELWLANRSARSWSFSPSLTHQTIASPLPMTARGTVGKAEGGGERCHGRALRERENLSEEQSETALLLLLLLACSSHQPTPALFALSQHRRSASQQRSFLSRRLSSHSTTR